MRIQPKFGGCGRGEGCGHTLHSGWMPEAVLRNSRRHRPASRRRTTPRTWIVGEAWRQASARARGRAPARTHAVADARGRNREFAAHRRTPDGSPFGCQCDPIGICPPVTRTRRAPGAQGRASPPCAPDAPHIAETRPPHHPRLSHPPVPYHARTRSTRRRSCAARATLAGRTPPPLARGVMGSWWRRCTCSACAAVAAWWPHA